MNTRPRDYGKKVLPITELQPKEGTHGGKV